MDIWIYAGSIDFSPSWLFSIVVSLSQCSMLWFCLRKQLLKLWRFASSNILHRFVKLHASYHEKDSKLSQNWAHHHKYALFTTYPSAFRGCVFLYTYMWSENSLDITYQEYIHISQKDYQIIFGIMTKNCQILWEGLHIFGSLKHGIYKECPRLFFNFLNNSTKFKTYNKILGRKLGMKVKTFH